MHRVHAGGAQWLNSRFLPSVKMLQSRECDFHQVEIHPGLGQLFRGSSQDSDSHRASNLQSYCQQRL